MESVKILIIAILALSQAAFCFDQDHKVWDGILKKHTKQVDGQVLFNYQALKKDESNLKKYLSELESVDKKEFKSFSKDEKLAYWINAYNAYTVKWILKHYPIKSIKDTGSLFSNPWKKEFIKLMGKEMSLDDIEHGTIRKQFKEARIHFAVNCASIGCPSLYQEAFIASKLDSQLEASAKFFLSNKKKNYRKGNTYHLSKIFDWYGEDFEKYHGSVEKYVEKYLGKASEIEFLDYDWGLNETK